MISNIYEIILFVFTPSHRSQNIKRTFYSAKTRNKKRDGGRITLIFVSFTSKVTKLDLSWDSWIEEIDDASHASHHQTFASKRSWGSAGVAVEAGGIINKEASTNAPAAKGATVSDGGESDG